MPTPFTISVSDSDLDDLLARVRNSRFTTASSPLPWAGGTDPDYLRALVRYWSTEFDWRTHESRLNQLPQFTAQVNGCRIHFLHITAAERPGRPPARAIVLAHGWPSCFVEMLALADRLAHPARYGSEAEAFDVVIPTLPGFLFSELPNGPLTRAAIAGLITELLVEELGYESFGYFGGDIGGVVGASIAAANPRRVIGLHQIHPSFPDSFAQPPLTDEERSFLASEESYDVTDGGYSAIMGTRPDTVAAALIDSPIGLAAWIVDKYRDWSDCDGDLATRFDFDTILEIVTLYWITGSIGTSFRQYLDYPANEARGPVNVPVAVTLSAEPAISGMPRSIAERAFTDLRIWSTPNRGGHFLAHEEPELAASEIRSFFSTLH